MTRWLGRELRQVQSTGSTNDDVLAAARVGAPHGFVLIADMQTRGRGRQGRSWASPPAANLYLSALLRPALPAAAAPPITLAAAVAVAEGLNELRAAASIKWPNDVLIQEKKVAGILTESVTRGANLEAVIVGIGVNLNWREPPPELAAIAISVSQATGHPVDRDAFTLRLLEHLEKWLDLLFAAGPAPIIAAWSARSATLGRRVLVDGPEPFCAVARAVDPDGALVVERDDGELVRVRSGEIKLQAVSS